MMIFIGNNTKLVTVAKILGSLKGNGKNKDIDSIKTPKNQTCHFNGNEHL